VAAGLIVCLGGVAQAAIVPVANASFENGDTPAEGGWVETSSAGNTSGLPSWSLITESIYLWNGEVNPHTSGNVNFSSSTAPDGTYAAMLKSPLNLDERQALYQAIGTVVAGTEYVMTVAAGAPTGTFGSPTKTFICLTTTPLAGLNQGETAHTAYTVFTISSGSFRDESVTLDAATATTVAGQTLYAYLWAKGTNGKDMAVFDNVRVVSTLIPEPATMSLLLVAGVGLLARRRRK